MSKKISSVKRCAKVFMGLGFTASTMPNPDGYSCVHADCFRVASWLVEGHPYCGSHAESAMRKLISIKRGV